MTVEELRNIWAELEKAGEALCNADNEALESEAQSAELSELSGLMVCGDDEWARR